MKIIKKLSVALVAVFALASCSEDFFDVNDSVNSPTSSTPELSLPVAQKQTADLISGGYNSYNTLGNLWSYTWAAGGDYIYFTDETEYLISSAFRATSFTNAYLGALNNYNVIIKNTEPENANYRAIAMIMTAYHYQYLVDLYGDVPYTEALQGAENTTPAYDDDKFIYDDLLVKLTEAQDMIAASSVDGTVLNPGSADVMLGGNMGQWSRFANTIKLRILLRQSEIGVTDYSSVNNGIGFLGQGETVTVNPGYINDVNKQNPLFGAFGEDTAGNPAANRNATRATPFALSLLAGDPRRARIFAPNNSGAYAGIEQNQSGGTPSSQLSGVGPGILVGSEQDALIMQSAESLFLQAEAVTRGFIPGDAAALYNLGVQESFTQLGAGNAATYLGINPYDGTVQTIIRQKFIANMGTHGIENYIEFRRTGFPAVPVAPEATSTVLPVRLLYPSSEAATNPENTPVQTSTEAFTSKVFWDL